MFEALGERLAAALKKISGRGVLRPEDVEAGLREVRLALLEADVNFKVVKEFVERVRARVAGVEISPGLTAPQTVIKAVNEELVQLLGGNAEGLRYAAQPPTVLMLVGLQGSGKTTTAVKLALLARRDGHRPLVAGLDFRRPAAVEQLKTLAEREGVVCVLPTHGELVLPIHGEVARSAGGAAGAPAGGAAGRAIDEAARLGCDVVILDTAGRLHVDAELMAELRQLKSRVRVTETLLVADSMTGQEAVKVGEAFGREVGVDGVILTKLDGDARGGAALSFRVATGERIRFAGTGEKPADLEVFHADEVACRQYAQSQVGVTPEEAATQSAVTSAAVGTAVGAAAGAVLGAAAGNAGTGAAIGAGSGLLLGGVSGAQASADSGATLQSRYDAAYIQCMYAKGNQVPGVATAPIHHSAPPPPPPGLPLPPPGLPPPPPPGPIDLEPNR